MVKTNFRKKPKQLTPYRRANAPLGKRRSEIHRLVQQYGEDTHLLDDPDVKKLVMEGLSLGTSRVVTRRMQTRVNKVMRPIENPVTPSGSTKRDRSICETAKPLMKPNFKAGPLSFKNHKSSRSRHLRRRFIYSPIRIKVTDGEIVPQISSNTTVVAPSLPDLDVKPSCIKTLNTGDVQCPCALCKSKKEGIYSPVSKKVRFQTPKRTTSKPDLGSGDLNRDVRSNCSGDHEPMDVDITGMIQRKVEGSFQQIDDNSRLSVWMKKTLDFFAGVYDRI